jgi:syntaxin 16
MEEIFSFIPDDIFGQEDDNKEEVDKDKDNNEEEEEHKDIIQNVVDVINSITNIEPKEEQKEEEFVSGITKDRYKQFCEYRTNFQNRFFHFIEKDFFDDTKKLINNSILFTENKNINSQLLRKKKYDPIELQNISRNLDNSNYIESYKEVNSRLKDLLANFASLKNLQQERIKPKFEDEEIENRKIDKKIKKLIIKMMEKIKFFEALTKMESIKQSMSKNQNPKENELEEKVKKNIKMFLIGKIKNFINEFRKNEQKFMQYLKELKGGDQEYLINANNINNDTNNINDSFRSSSDDEEKNDSKKDFLLTQDDDIHLQIKKRDKDINVLANSINELSGIFKDLKSVVQEQGTILDRIDYNIDVSYENSQRGLKHIKQAEEHQNESCFRNVILLLFFIIFVESILIIMKIL